MFGKELGMKLEEVIWWSRKRNEAFLWGYEQMLLDAGLIDSLTGVACELAKIPSCNGGTLIKQQSLLQSQECNQGLGLAELREILRPSLILPFSRSRLASGFSRITCYCWALGQRNNLGNKDQKENPCAVHWSSCKVGMEVLRRWSAVELRISCSRKTVCLFLNGIFLFHCSKKYMVFCCCFLLLSHLEVFQ